MRSVEEIGETIPKLQTYFIDGRQYIVVAIGGGNQPAELVAPGAAQDPTAGILRILPARKRADT